MHVVGSVLVVLGIIAAQFVPPQIVWTAVVLLICLTGCFQAYMSLHPAPPLPPKPPKEDRDPIWPYIGF